MSNYLKTEFNSIEKSNSLYNKKKVITLLKSPHVNKTSQEKFECRVFLTKMLLRSSFLNKNFIFIKKVLTNLFQDISIKIEFMPNSILNNFNCKSILELDTFEFFRNLMLKDNTQRKKIKNRKTTNFSTTKFSHFLLVISGFGESLTLQTRNKSK